MWETMTVMSVATFVSILSVNAQPIGQIRAGSTQEPPAHEIDCRTEFKQSMNALNQMMARLDAADRSHDARAIRNAVMDARRLLASVKAKVAACSADADVAVTVDPVCLRNVDPKSAPTATYRGKRYVFCSNANKAKVERDPKRYIRGTAQ